MVPVNRSFSYVYEQEPFSEVINIESSDHPEDMTSGTDPHPYHYKAINAGTHFSCYLYSDTRLTEEEKVTLPSRLVGIAIHSADNSGIWMQYPVFVYEC